MNKEIQKLYEQIELVREKCAHETAYDFNYEGLIVPVCPECGAVGKKYIK
jgi:hypothetical protein